MSEGLGHFIWQTTTIQYTRRSTQQTNPTPKTMSTMNPNTKPLSMNHSHPTVARQVAKAATQYTLPSPNLTPTIPLPGCALLKREILALAFGRTLASLLLAAGLRQ